VAVGNGRCPSGRFKVSHKDTQSDTRKNLKYFATEGEKCRNPGNRIRSFRIYEGKGLEQFIGFNTNLFVYLGVTLWLKQKLFSHLRWRFINIA